MRFNYSSTARKSKRSQSALEYMMTYGWAILIIVIVAVILYSMGIFNPSSSVTFTSSGFSPFTVSSSLCNNIGYKIAVLAGPIPNNANSLTINKVYLTSATGANTTTASYTLTNPVTLKSGQSATILIPNVACNSANIHYSLSAKIQYSYTASTLGLQNVNTTGTVAGTSITGKPSTLTSYEPITITNTQGSATPNPFQQMINFTSSDPGFSSIATGNFGQNVEFFYYNGTIIPSWLENYTSTNATWWLKIAAIPGGSSETVYVGFAPTSTDLFNTVNDGEAPQLSSNYGEYFDAPTVFSYAADFAGTSLPSSIDNVGASGYYSVDNSLVLTNSTDQSVQTLFTDNTSYNPLKTGFIIKGNFPSQSDYYFGFMDQSGMYIGSNTEKVGSQYNSNIVIWYVNNSGFATTYEQGIANFGSQTIRIWQVAPTVTGYYQVNNTAIGSYRREVDSELSSFGISWQTVSEPVTLYYVVLYALTPNGVMPSVSFDSIA